MIVVALLTINTNYPHLTLTLHFLRKRLLIRFVMVGVLVLRLSDCRSCTCSTLATQHLSLERYVPEVVTEIDWLFVAPADHKYELT
jgi:hypothetical protein